MADYSWNSHHVYSLLSIQLLFVRVWHPGLKCRFKPYIKEIGDMLVTSVQSQHCADQSHRSSKSKKNWPIIAPSCGTVWLACSYEPPKWNLSVGSGNNLSCHCNINTQMLVWVEEGAFPALTFLLAHIFFVFLHLKSLSSARLSAGPKQAWVVSIQQVKKGSWFWTCKKIFFKNEF